MPAVSGPFARPGRRRGFVWPPRTGPTLEMRRFERVDDGWEEPVDRYPGETVLDDLGPDVSDEDALVIIARFAALRVAMLAARNELGGEALVAERVAAAGYARILPRRVSEREILGDIARPELGGRRSTTTRVCRLLREAASAAVERGHLRGAFGLYHGAWDLAIGGGALREAARTARALAELAGREGAQRSARLWARRARSLERRLERQTR